MKTSSPVRFHWLLRASLLMFLLVSVAVPLAHAGLTLEMNVIRYDQFGYYFSPNLGTNSAAPSVPFGDYYITSSGYPTNGASAFYHYDTNGFNQIGGGSYGYGDFDGMMHELTNGNWSIFVTNATTTNVFYFTVTANIASNSLPLVSVTFPTNGAVNVTNQPVYTWQGPTNYSGLVIYGYNFGNELPVTQTSFANPNVLYQGINSFTAHYDSNSVTAVVSSVPTNGLATLSGWVSTVHLQDYVTSQFTVGIVDTSGTSHILVAHYPWDGTNDDGSASGADTSGNGYDMNFGGGFGSQGEVNSTEDPAAGPRAIQFHNGDGNSAGYVGWNPTPPNILAALAGSFSVSCWIKTTQNTAWDDAPAYYGAGIISADNGGQANDLIPLALTGSKVGFNTGGDVEDVTLNSTASVNDGNYHHVVVTRNQQTGQKIIYIDGELDSFSSGTTNLLNDPQLLTIGALADANDSDASSTYYYNGYDGELDDLQIYSGVLSSGEVANLFANPGSTATNGGGITGGHKNVAHYTFDTTSTNTFDLGVDSSPNDNNLGGYSDWGQVHTNSTDAAAGGGAVQFFGTSDMNAIYQTQTNLNAVLAGSFSFSAWVKTTASRGNDYDNAYYGATIFWAYNLDGNTNDTIPLAITGGKAAFTTRGGDSGDFDTLHSLTSVNDGNYHLITVTRDQGTGEKKIYVDGNFEASQFGTANPLNGNKDQITVGGTVYSSYTGLLDDLQIYTGVLSDADVAYLYANPGSSVPDVTGQDFNAALNTTNLNWTTSGDANWFVESTVTHDGLAAQSGALTDNTKYSSLQTTVTGPGTLTFWWSSAADDGDFDLEFDIDGGFGIYTDYDDLYGNTGWTQDTFIIPAGVHTLTWFAYDADSFNDAGFLGQVIFVPDQINATSAPVITVNPINQTNSPGYTVGLYAAATSNPTATWQWFKVGSGLITNATSALYIPTNSGTAGVAGSYYAVASNSLGTATTRTASVSFVSASLPPDWSRAFKSSFANDSSDETTNYNIACLIDSTGTNIYTVGSFVGTNTFGSDSLISINGQSGSSFLKQTATGTPIWGRCMTNNGNGSSYAQSVAAAPGGGIYVAGVVFGTNWLGTNQLVDIAGGSTYVARFDASGSNLWVRLMTGTNFNFSTYHMLASDPDGNVTVSSLIWGYTSFGTTNLFADGQRGVLVQYDANGNLRWLQLPSGWPESLVYNAGRLYGSMGGGSPGYIGGVTNISDRRHTLFSLNATNGQAYWLQGVAAQMDQGPTVFGNDDALLAISGTNIFITGNAYGSNAVFGPFTVNFPVNEGQYLARYDTNGNAQLATAFGSAYTWPWAIGANAAGDVYIGGDFDTYSVFGSNVISAPFYETIQSIGSIDNRIPGQSFMAKFDRNGNALWARTAQSQSSYLNMRDLAVAPDGVWACGFFNQPSVFGTNTIYGGITVFGFPFGELVYHPSGYLAKITDSTAILNPLLLNPADNGVNFQFQFLTQSGFIHAVQYRTNLILGNWLNYSNVTGDGNLKTIPIPLSVFAPSPQGFVRVTNAVAP